MLVMQRLLRQVEGRSAGDAALAPEGWGGGGGAVLVMQHLLRREGGEEGGGLSIHCCPFQAVAGSSVTSNAAMWKSSSLFDCLALNL